MFTGFQMPPKPNLIGIRFGKLVVLSTAPSRNNKACWRCRCACGNEKVIRAGALKDGFATSCGCSRSQSVSVRRLKHGLSQTPEYRAFAHAKLRCENPNDRAYADYGGRGIKFLFESFEHFLRELGVRPQGMELDRFPDNNGNYEPGNVRWATHKENLNNRRKYRRRT